MPMVSMSASTDQGLRVSSAVIDRASAFAAVSSPVSLTQPSSSRLVRTRCPDQVCPTAASNGKGAGRSDSGRRCSMVKVHDDPCSVQPGGAGASSARWSVTRSERSEEHTSELQSLMRISYAVFCLKKKKKNKD